MGQTPLHWALFNNHPEVIFSLIARGAVIDNNALYICPDPEVQQIVAKHYAIAHRASRRKSNLRKTRGYRSKFLHHQRSNDEKELVRLYTRANEIVNNQVPTRKIRNADLVKMLQGLIEEKEKMNEFKEQFKVERNCEMVCGAQIN
jgi:ankyrin repeat protein